MQRAVADALGEAASMPSVTSPAVDVDGGSGRWPESASVGTAWVLSDVHDSEQRVQGFVLRRNQGFDAVPMSWKARPVRGMV